MKLAKDIVRINYNNPEGRGHKDVKVAMHKIISNDIEREVPVIYIDNLIEANNIIGATSYNYWNWAGNERITCKIN